MADFEYLTVSHLNRKQLARIFSKIAIDPITGCWNWTGALAGGYGTTSINDRCERSHRVVYAWLVEPIPRGHGQSIPQIDHFVCSNRRCCNPQHLKLVSARDNALRSNSVSGHFARQTHCVNGHAFPPFRNRSDGKGRACVTCRNTRQREAKRLKAFLKRSTAIPKVKPSAEEVAAKKRAYFRDYTAKNKDRLREMSRAARKRRRDAKRQQATAPSLL